ncbi:MAG: hypothetical protein H7X88_05525, partial [Gloeobacteraceae cyanobacterium ES-bin-316]|nr:hypothetical protein [Ferruginibacter sp.]
MKKYIQLTIWASLIFPVAIRAQQKIEATINSTLTGKIVDSETQTPLEGAVIQIK